MRAVMALRKRATRTRSSEATASSSASCSFFVKAAVEALKAFPAVNAEIRGDDDRLQALLRHRRRRRRRQGPGRAGDPRRRRALLRRDREADRRLRQQRAKDNKLTLDELQGGTFTITNGGIYGSMLSTPILNPPQTGILGMHNIAGARRWRVDGQVVIRPMMYVALTYDHRLVDGREAVPFLVTVKECIEGPTRMLLEI